MSFMDDTDITYNGIHFSDFGFLSVDVGGSRSKHIFAPSKTLNTVKPAYRTRSIAVGQTAENLTFNLTFSLLNVNFTEDFNKLLYQILDVETYKPLKFGNDDFYYNAIPFVGSASELTFAMQHQGYITIPFVCDAPHGWIDRVYEFSRQEGEEGTPWKSFQGEGNVRSGDGTYTVYPYLEIEIDTTKTGSNKQGYVSFSLAITDDTISEQSADIKQMTKYDEPNPTWAVDGRWWTLYNLDKKCKIAIDGENMQFYYFKWDDTTSTYIEDLNDSLLKHMNNKEFIFALHSNTLNKFWHRGISDNIHDSSAYTMKMYVSYPVMR